MADKQVRRDKCCASPLGTGIDKPLPEYLLSADEGYGRKVAIVEPSGNVRFQVERFDADGRVVKVNAKKL